jgi:hypothetical protein
VRNTRRKSCGLNAIGLPSTWHSLAVFVASASKFRTVPELIVLRLPMRKLRWNR